MCDSYKINMGGKVCRSCLTNTEDMKSLHDPYTTEMCVADVFTLITSLKCSGDNDVLPTQMCHECFDELHSSYQFVLKSQQSNKKLQVYLNDIQKTKEEIVTDNTRHISDITITDCVRSVQTENATNLTATTLMNTCEYMNDVIEEIQLDVETELNSLSNNLTLSNRDLSIENETTSKKYQSNVNIYEHSYKPITTLQAPLLIAKMQNDLDQEFDFIKCEIDIDVKSERTNDINIKDSNAIKNEPANEQDIAIAFENHLQSNQIDFNNEMQNEIDDYFITIDINQSTFETSAMQKDPLLIAEMQNDLDQELDLIKHEIDIDDVKTEITNDINYKDCNAETSNDIQHPAERKYTCAVCNKSFNLKGNLIVHMRKHTGEKPYACKICSKTFSENKSVVQHTRTHTEEKPYECKFCSKTFSVKAGLRGHTRTHNGKKPHTCKICSKTFSVKTHLVLHTRTHTGEKPYACKICLKTFSIKSNLVVHSRTHTREKPYACKHCSKTFFHSSSLVLHTRTHTGEKPFVCNICSKTFIGRTNLVRHTRTHTGEKPYACKICSKAFIVTSDLVKHMRTHTGEKPYACKICSKTFSLKARLIGHTPTHTGEKPYV